VILGVLFSGGVAQAQCNLAPFNQSYFTLYYQISANYNDGESTVFQEQLQGQAKMYGSTSGSQSFFVANLGALTGTGSFSIVTTTDIYGIDQEVYASVTAQGALSGSTGAFPFFLLYIDTSNCSVEFTPSYPTQLVWWLEGTETQLEPSGAAYETFPIFISDVQSSDPIYLVGPIVTTPSVTQDYGLGMCAGTLNSKVSASGNQMSGTVTYSLCPGYGGGTPAGGSYTLSWSTSPVSPMTSPPSLGPTGPNNPQSCCGDPISTGNGNFYYSATDLSVFDHVRDLPLVFQRSYNSLDNFSGPLGNNWTHNFNTTVSTNSAGATVKWGDGHSEVYTLTGGSYVPGPGVTNTLSLNSTTNQYVLTRKDGVSYFFTSSGLLASITDPNGVALGTVRDGKSNLTQILCTSCPGAASLSLTYNSNNLISNVADSTGRSISYIYDSNGNLLSETDPAGKVTNYAYDSSNRLTSVTLPNGSVQSLNIYDSKSRVISQTNALGNKTTLAYNTPQAGQTTITDPLGHSTIHTYDTLMRLVGITDALGNATSYVYDSNNDLTAITDARGNTKNFSYDPLRNVLSSQDALGNTTSFTYNSFSEPLTTKTSKGNTTTLTYDAKGNLTSVQDPLGNQSSFSYNGFGQVISTKDARNNTTSFAYNSSSLCLIGMTDALGNQTSLACDAVGRPTSTRDPNKHTSTIAYDPLNRITSLTDALGDQTSFAYDSVSNLTSITDANQHMTAYAYDGIGNLLQVTDALGHKTTYGYDQNNNRVTFTNANEELTKFGYDADNRAVLITDPLSFYTTYALDQAGNVTGLTDANGKQNTFSYDVDNRLTNASYSDGTTVAYSYDPDGNRTTMADPHGTTSYSYDALDRVLSMVFPGGSAVQYSYDQNGNRSSLTYPDKGVVTFAYDADNRLSGVTDWHKREILYSYDPASNLIGTMFPNNTKAALTYDAANRVTGITYSDKLPYRIFRYTLDKVGNRTAIFDTVATTNYTYDAVNELLAAQLGPLRSSWKYDAVGNRTSVDFLGLTINYSYDADDRMLTMGPTKLTYDNNGNRLTFGATKYVYDANNRLISVVEPTGSSTFSYDGDGNRIAHASRSGSYEYVNDTARPLPVVLNEMGPSGAIDFAYGEGLTESSSSAFNYFYNLDDLGSVSNLTDAIGRVQGVYSYDPWGNKLISVGGARNEFQFAGQPLDAATGLYFMRARYYDPVSGHFLSRDPLAGVGRFPVSLNRNTYALNNPLRFIDPSGQQAAGEPDWEPGYEPSSNALWDWLSDEEQNALHGYLSDLWEQYYFNLAHGGAPQPLGQTCLINPAPPTPAQISVHGVPRTPPGLSLPPGINQIPVPLPSPIPIPTATPSPTPSPTPTATPVPVIPVPLP
jgi:RHS repeat-associated protein